MEAVSQLLEEEVYLAGQQQREVGVCLVVLELLVQPVEGYLAVMLLEPLVKQEGYLVVEGNNSKLQLVEDYSEDPHKLEEEASLEEPQEVNNKLEVCSEDLEVVNNSKVVAFSEDLSLLNREVVYLVGLLQVNLSQEDCLEVVLRQVEDIQVASLVVSNNKVEDNFLLNLPRLQEAGCLEEFSRVNIQASNK